MKETSATGRHAAPPAPPAKPVKEKTESSVFSRRSGIRGRSVLGGLALVAVILLILGLALRGASEERQYREHLRAAEESCAAGDYETALGHLRMAASHEETSEIRERMVDCYVSLGNFEKALELLRQMDLGDETVRARIDELENARELLRQADKIIIAGMEYERNSSSLILRRTELGEEELQRVSELYSLSSLSLTEDGLRDVSALSGLGGLTMLDLSGNEITDLTPLASLSSLRTLYLDGNPITDFTPLASLQELTTLSIRGIEISEAQLSALSEALPRCAIHSETAVAEVRELTLGGVTFREDVTELDLSSLQLSDVSALSACRQLLTLDLSGNEIADLTPLMDLPYLETLRIRDNRVSDLRPLMAMKSLQAVDAAGNSITSTAPLAALTELRELDLSGNELTDLSGLVTLSALEILRLENTHLTDEQLPHLNGLSALRLLDIKENPELTGEAVEALKRSLSDCTFENSRLVYTVELDGERYRRDLTILDLSGKGRPFDFSGIEWIPDLEKLDLSGNDIEYVNCLKTLIKLRELDLSDNCITDLSPLAALYNLEKLDLSNNRISTITPLLSLPHLKELDIRGNDLEPGELIKLENSLTDCTIYHD